jgi:hypothetical protein
MIVHSASSLPLAVRNVKTHVSNKSRSAAPVTIRPCPALIAFARKLIVRRSLRCSQAPARIVNAGVFA